MRILKLFFNNIAMVLFLLYCVYLRLIVFQRIILRICIGVFILMTVKRLFCLFGIILSFRLILALNRMEVRYFDILSFLRRFSSDSKNPIERFVSAFVLNSLLEYQLRDSSIFSYVWHAFNDKKLDLYDVQKFIECYAFKRGHFDPTLCICVNMIKAIYTAFRGM